MKKIFSAGRVPLRDAGERAVRYKVKALKTRAKAAVAFARSLGINVESLVVKDLQTKPKSVIELEESVDRSSSVQLNLPKVHSLYSECSTRKQGRSSTEPSRLEAAMQRHGPSDGTSLFNRLEDTKKEEVYQLLFMLDRFYTSDEGFHELTMHKGGELLPQSYIVRECRKEINSLRKVEILSVDNIRGAQFDLKELLVDEIKDYLTCSGLTLELGEEMKVKFAGDGAKMSRKSSFQMFSFSLLNRGTDVMKSHGVRTVACVSGPENYDILKVGMERAFAAVNDLVKEGKIQGQVWLPLTLFLCGDVKYKQAVLGLKDSTAEQSCPCWGSILCQKMLHTIRLVR